MTHVWHPYLDSCAGNVDEAKSRAFVQELVLIPGKDRNDSRQRV